MHRVDVIVPCYNYARFLDRSLGSVVAQTCGDFRVLVIDNASTDDTAAVTRQWQERDGRIDYLCNAENLGLVGSLHKAVDLTQAPYLVVLPADDYWGPRFLELTAGALDAQPDVAVAYTRWAEDHGGDQHILKPFPHGADGLYQEASLLLIYNWIPLSFGLIRRERWTEVGGLRKEYGQFLDYDLWLRMARRWPFYYLDELAGHIGCHDANWSRELKTSGQAHREEIQLRHELFVDPQWPLRDRLLIKAREANGLVGVGLVKCIEGLARTYDLPDSDLAYMRAVAAQTAEFHMSRFFQSRQRAVALLQRSAVYGWRMIRRLWNVWRQEDHRSEKTRWLLRQWLSMAGW